MSKNTLPNNLTDATGVRFAVPMAVAPVIAAKPLYEAQDQAQEMQGILDAAGAHGDNPHASPVPDIITNNLDAVSATGAGLATYFGLGLFNRRGGRVESPRARGVRAVAGFVVGLTVAIAEKYMGMR